MSPSLNYEMKCTHTRDRSDDGSMTFKDVGVSTGHT
jgi:hypothetical protein